MANRTQSANKTLGITRWFSLLAFIVGALTALQSRVNGRLSIHIHNGVAAGLLSNLTGWALLTLIIIFSAKDRESFVKTLRHLRKREIHWWEALGGLGGACFLAVQSSTVPIIGIALFTIGLVAGQTSTSLLVDKLGISPSGKMKITSLRVLTAILTLTGVTIAVAPKLSQGNFHFIYMLLALSIGIIVSFQQALNGRLNIWARRPFVTAWFNFGVGTGFLILFMAINITLGGTIQSLPNNPLMYTGGVIGLTFIAISAYTIKQLGVLNFIISSVAGQLLTALAVDAIAPTENAKLSLWVILGTATTLFSISIPKLAPYFSDLRR